MTFNAETYSAIIITCVYPICLLKVSPVGSFKHLPDGRGTQITAYFYMQLASKSSSLISYIVYVSYQPISVYFWMVKTYKIQRENILQRPTHIHCVYFMKMNLQFSRFCIHKDILLLPPQTMKILNFQKINK